MRDSNGRFAGGESGNTKGAPKKRKPRVESSFAFLMDTRIATTVAGVARHLSIEETLQRQTFADALAGKRMAERDVRKWILKRDKYLSQHKPPVERKEIQHISSGPRNADSALLLLGITRPHSNGRSIDGGDGGPQHEIETWAVEAALSKYRFKPMSKQKLDDIRRDTVDGYQLNLTRIPLK